MLGALAGHGKIVVTAGWGWSGLPYLGRKRAKRAKEGRAVWKAGRERPLEGRKVRRERRMEGLSGRWTVPPFGDRPLRRTVEKGR
jgi:hypothetical protein